ncbi:phosphoribosylglycinamide formyltransferase [Alicyclobacillus fastidiosus]|uniref:Phosphoribosylglycinamide formyltransferase n=1 Tax=Alicyclobacillus fastidiosus TaxID=392011 RepID=A0ABY6ZFJ5_9BACL|nr:phosphoribosylglycinamide formyltransferase [Alicyclobacillus fastidiosus]WAH41627.1 phosphoribosylglycinamide formyltransferase [Alicyclobacillus fastidiosus]GMA63294.1 phosphoribosylglycinamide formyltransferase [Alicyclobacillus fastidiosus]
MTLSLGFLASYNGSSMRAIVQAIESGRLDAEAAVVISNNPDAGALAAAEQAGIPAYCLNAKRCGSADVLDDEIARVLIEHKVDYVILSGYMKHVGKRTLEAFPDRILNVHPSLLPAFGGPGMYGLRVHAAVLQAGVEETGATIHFVDEVYDHGRILAQVRVPVLPGDTPESLRTRVGAEEGELYVSVIQQLIEEQKRPGELPRPSQV